MRLSLLLIFIFPIISFSQTGSVSGIVLDKNYNNAPLAFATVIIKGTTKGSNTDFDGKFIIENISPGKYTLVVSFIGYRSEELENIIIKPNQTESVSVTLAQDNNLDEVVITDTANRQSESVLIGEQKKAIAMTTAIGADEISKKGISNVATAVSKTSGISKESNGGGIYVRGLGDRYNITTLNRLPMPSNNPQNKNISLDIFSTNIVENISISKIFNLENYGDFSGANININSKVQSARPFLQIQLRGALNSNVLNLNDFYLQDGPSSSGFYDQNYNAESLVKYNFNSWDRTKVNSPFNKNFTINAGKTFKLKNSSLNIFATIKHRNNYGYQSGISRGNVNTENLAFTDLSLKNYSYNTNSTAMVNLHWNIKSGNSISFNSLYINSSEQFHKEYRGILQIFDKGSGFIRFSGFDRTSIWVNQLLGKNKINEALDIDWGIGYNTVDNIIPNRMMNTLIYIDENDITKGFIPSTQASSENNRFYQNLKENELAGNLFLNYRFQPSDDQESDSYRGKISLGYSLRLKNVDFNALQFNFAMNKTANFPVIRAERLDAFFNQSSIDNNLFKVVTFRGDANTPNALDPQTYNGSQNIHAFFTALQYRLSSRFTGIIGFRGEQTEQSISWETQLDPVGGNKAFNIFQFLPNLSLKYELNEKQNLKFAASKTYTLPQFKERAPFQFEYITNIEFGNPSLYASTNYNVDLKWELFPSSDELFSVNLFGKHIQNPINKVVVASATNDLSFVNTGSGANVFGLELEAKKTLLKIGKNQDLKLGFNTSIMSTHQDFNNEKISKETNLSVFFSKESGPLTGASPLLVNTDLTYTNRLKNNRSLITSLAFNYFSDRVFAIGVSGRGNQVDNSVGTLNFIMRYKAFKGFEITLRARNLLNPKIIRIQENNTLGNIILNSYKLGIVSGMGFSYRF